MQTELQIAWIVGEASRQGLSFTDTEVQQSLQQIKSQLRLRRSTSRRATRLV